MKSSPFVRRTASPSSKNIVGANGEIVDGGVVGSLAEDISILASARLGFRSQDAPDMVYRRCQGRGWQAFPFLKKASLLQDFADQIAWFIKTTPGHCSLILRVVNLPNATIQTSAGPTPVSLAFFTVRRKY
ncbi:hypothetical protein ACJ73_00655 [Blastomyces percursus]|uniref:Uncharacterized protein n=1 Tax=Blastomyces percursus TaxID=1658174 RepID=A0A1J9R6E8_9EURO|nr:hypothetical protein ACJ73_00655 [Blastomyces percursus]